MSQHKFSMTKFFPMKWKNRKNEKGPFFSEKKRRQQTIQSFGRVQKTRKQFRKKNVVFEKREEYVKGFYQKKKKTTEKG